MTVSESSRARQRRAGANGRELHALAACLLWLLGFEVAPLAHIATHVRGEAHHHDARGATIFEDEGGRDDGYAFAHCHGGACHAHDHDAHGAERAPGHGRRETSRGVHRAATPHGAHSLLHRGIAALAPKLATPHVRPALVCELGDARAPEARVASRAPRSVRVRGPPAPSV